MADREKQIRLFERVASQRLAAAAFLFKHNFYLDAVYLAGYAVECSLKALILRRTPRNELTTVYEELTEVGAKGHDFEYLKRLLKERLGAQTRRDRETLGALAVYLLDVGSWSTDLRYQAGTLHPSDAQRFVKAATAIRNLCARS